MTDFASLRVKVGRRPITVVELDLDFCSRTYGTSPCTAAIGTTGTQKCFNTYRSCQDTANYGKTTKTYRFTDRSSFLPVGDNVFPCITGLDIAPTQIDPEGFSVSASVTVSLEDFPHHDRGIDPYASERAASGTFFGRLRARNPYLENRVMRVCTGYIDDGRTIYTQSRTYFIDRIEGPDASGKVRLVGKDALRFADAEKAKAPAQSKGSLSATLTNVASTLTLVPAGIGSDYPASGTVRIEDEVITYSSKSGDTLNGLTRGTDGTAADAHDAATTVQLCLRYTAATLPAVMNDLLVNYAGLASGYVPLTDWNTENDTWLSTFTCTALLTEPTGVKDLLQELVESTGCILWWDDIAAQVKWKVIVPPLPSTPPAKLTDAANILAGSFSVKDTPKDRVSQVSMYFLLNGPTADLKAVNFKSVSIQVDATGEGVNAYGTTKERVILNRWVPTEQLATEIAARILNRYKETPRQITFRLDAKDATLKTGDLVDVSSRLIQDMNGNPMLIRYLVTESREVEIGSHYEYTCMQVSGTAGGSAALIAPDGTADWTVADDIVKQSYMFISNNSGFMSDGSIAPHIV